MKTAFIFILLLFTVAEHLSTTSLNAKGSNPLEPFREMNQTKISPVVAEMLLKVSQIFKLKMELNLI